MIPVKTPTEAANAIEKYTLPMELRIPSVVNTASFKANTRRILAKRGIKVKLTDAKREEYKGIWVTLCNSVSFYPVSHNTISGRR